MEKGALALFPHQRFAKLAYIEALLWLVRGLSIAVYWGRLHAVGPTSFGTSAAGTTSFWTNAVGTIRR